MARGSTYGDMLREARMRRGMDIHSVARRLRLRADILMSIEEADFASLPPAGYTRNMINSYARLVGLDPREVSTRYLEELRLFETGRFHAASSPTRYGNDRGGSRISQSVHPRSPRVRRSVSASDTAYNQRSYYDRSTPDFGETPHAMRREPSRAGYAARSRSVGYASPTHPPARSEYFPRDRGDREVLRAYDSYAFRPSDARVEQRKETKSRSLSPSAYATSPYAGLYSRRDHGQKAGALDLMSNMVAAIAQRLPLVIGVVAVIVLLVVIVSFISKGEGPAPDETPTMPISGLTDTSNQNADAYNMNATETAPTSAKFSFDVASGSRSWMQIEVDGKTVVDETVRGPVQEEYEFTDSVEFRCGNVSPVTITVDGKEVKPTYSERDGEYVYNIAFSSILSEWQRAHPGSSTGSSSSSASSSSSGSSSSSSNR